MLFLIISGIFNLTLENMKTFFILLFLLPFGLFAQDWTLISADSSGSIYYIRKHSRREGDTKIWIKEVGNKIEYTNSAKKKLFIKGYKLFLLDTNCEEMQMAVLQTALYNSLGKLVQNKVEPSYSVTFEDVIPDSIGEFWLNEACSLLNPSEESEEEAEELEEEPEEEEEEPIL